MLANNCSTSFRCSCLPQDPGEGAQQSQQFRPNGIEPFWCCCLASRAGRGLYGVSLGVARGHGKCHIALEKGSMDESWMSRQSSSGICHGKRSIAQRCAQYGGAWLGRLDAAHEVSLLLWCPRVATRFSANKVHSIFLRDWALLAICPETWLDQQSGTASFK